MLPRLPWYFNLARAKRREREKGSEDRERGRERAEERELEREEETATECQSPRSSGDSFCLHNEALITGRTGGLGAAEVR